MTEAATSPPKPTRWRPGRRLRKYSPHGFYLTVLALGVVCLLSFVSGPHRARPESAWVQGTGLVTRDVDIFKHKNVTDSQDCHLVRKASDQCAFVRTHCPDEEAGLVSYLELYYCDLRDAKPVALTIIILWLGMLFSTIGIAASDFFCVNLSTIASILGMSESLAGVTFLAFGNGSPDVFSTFAAMGSKSGSLAVGELIGAAGFITAVVAGSMAMVRPFKVAKRSFVRDVGFFVVAAGFSLVFLRDGKLYLWECCLMVGFYVFYVAFVVAWHWWLGRKRARREAYALARDHFAHGADVEPVEEYHDDEDMPAGPRSGTATRTTSAHDLATLERGATEWSDDSEVPEDTRERWLGEISNNMRLRPQIHPRRGTMNPIRPSLVGALEFRAVMAGLQKSRNIQTMPINLRRYSDDPTFTAAQQADQLSTTSDPPVRSQYDAAIDAGAQRSRPGSFLDVRAAQGGRMRAVSANGADQLRYDPSSLRNRPGRLASVASQASEDDRSPHGSTTADNNLLQLPQSQAGTSNPSIQVSLTPPASDRTFDFEGAEPERPHDGATPSFLVPPNGDFYVATNEQDRPTISRQVSPGTHPTQQPSGSAEADPHAEDKSKLLDLPKLQIPGDETHDPRSHLSSPSSPFPVFSDDPQRLRSRSSTLRSRASSFQGQLPGAGGHSMDANGQLKTFEEPDRPPRWWPRILPSPFAIGSALFPTLCGWREKNIWEKGLGIVAAPSVFLLAITLPVVEAEGNDMVDEEGRAATLSLPPPAVPYTDEPHVAKNSVAILTPELQTADEHEAHADGRPAAAYHSLAGHGNTASTSVAASRHRDARDRRASLLPLLSPGQPRQLESPEVIPSTPTAVDTADDKDWNRWLMMIHCFTSPLFCVLIVYANFQDNFGWTGRTLLKMSLYTLIGSLAGLAIVLTASTPTRAPKWRTSLCFVGFCVSIAWISTVANEVVGVLKAVGVILNMSDAILGLTVFAVGNSLGDLVADVTVARLGFPVMALSACFGGPMLNILLGIGLSGMYFTVKHARDKQHAHPDDPVRFKPFHVDVGGTLLISGATLLFTLLVLLVIVPARGWRMDRVVGATVIAIWVLSTVANVVIEALGYSDDFGSKVW